MSRLNSQIVFISLLILLPASSLTAASETDFKQAINFSRVVDCAPSILKPEPGNNTAAKSDSDHFSYPFSAKNPPNHSADISSLNENSQNTSLPYLTALQNKSKDQNPATVSNNKLPANTKQQDRFKFYLSGDYGYDNNIDSSPNDGVIDIAGTFFNLYASINFQISGDIDNGWVTDASYYKNDYNDLNIYDFEQSTFGLKKQQKISDWLTCMQVNLLTSTYAGDDYQSGARLSIKGRKPLYQNKYLYLTYIFENIDSENPVYNYLEGRRQRARIDYRHNSGQFIQQLYYELELNQRGSLVTSSYAYDYSPTRHTLYAGYTRILDNSWRLSGDISYRQSDYPASSTVHRVDDQFKYSLSAIYYFDWSFQLVTRLELTDNRSTMNRYDYDKSLFKIGLDKRF